MQPEISGGTGYHGETVTGRQWWWSGGDAATALLLLRGAAFSINLDVVAGEAAVKQHAVSGKGRQRLPDTSDAP